MRAIEKILIYLFIAIAATILALIIFDTIQVCVTQGSDYMLSENEAWNRKSLFNYVATNILYIAILSLFFTVGVIKLRHKKKDMKVWNILFYVFFLLMFSSIIYGTYHWAITGFDH